MTAVNWIQPLYSTLDSTKGSLTMKNEHKTLTLYKEENTEYIPEYMEFNTLERSLNYYLQFKCSLT